MSLALLAFVIVLLIAVWIFARSRQASTSQKSTPAMRASSSNTAYHAVSIKFPSNACAAAKEMANRRFLSSAAPRLPLAECNVMECKCRFVHHKDRRTSKDRRSPFGPSGFGGATGRFDVDHREGKERRASEDEDLF
ncbi:MAG: hypothetical protein OEM60_05020 [Gammaproteobacteria bacterium]|nr:hypothetical protein [Gammaproteobacteria bacterium]MDH3432154.1 hypothetical protein [Gammaproteobacteria bacterium]MDH3433194.1 hypothetical protein [Gammaproteobacteria bacterium]